MMPKLTRVLATVLCLAGFARPGYAASFDFSFLSGGTSIGQGSFGFPDADLSLPSVDVSQFTSFNLTVGGRTFSIADLFSGSYLPGTNSFKLGPYIRGLPLYQINTAYSFSSNPDGSLVLTVPTFYVGASAYDSCYYLGLCGSQYSLIFTGYDVSIDVPNNTGSSLYTQLYVAHFDTFLITPAAGLVPEPGAASMLAASLAGLGILTRRRQATGC